MGERAVLERVNGLTTAELAAALDVRTPTSDLAQVNHEQLERVAHFLSGQPDFRRYEPAAWDDPLFWNIEASDADRSQYLAVGNAINFRFWDVKAGEVVPSSGTISGKHFRGAMYMWRSLRRCVDADVFPLLDAESLSKINEEQFEAIFVDDEGINPLAPAQAERIANLRDLGSRLRDEWDGEFFNVARSSHGSLVTFVKLSARFRAFDDPVFKLTMVNAILHSGSGVYRFQDQPLPGIDYHLLRHVLRQGILEPRRDLTEKLLRGVFLTTEEALVLRRTALAIFIELARRTGISGEILDNKYWLNRANCRDTEPVCVSPETAAQCPFFGVCSERIAFALPLEQTRYY